MEVTRSHYQLLGVDEDADLETLRAAYHRLAKSMHPDARVGESDADGALADRRMREISEAWQVLRQPERRLSYDRELIRERDRAAAARLKVEPPDPRIVLRDADAGPDRGVGSDDEDLDDVELSAPMAFILRRGPIIAVLVVAAALFIGSAYAGGDRDSDDGPPTTNSETLELDADSSPIGN